MLNDIQKEAEKRMQKSLDALRADYTKIRTGRAHHSFLDHIKVDYYGSETPLAQVASVTVSDPRTLMVQPWEKNMVATVEKAIRDAGLGLNPAAAGNSIRIPMPALTEERRRDLVKIVKSEAENARVAVRNIRRDANNQLKDLLKDKEISEDDERRGIDQIQKLTDKMIAQIDEMLSKKETDVLEV